MSNAVYRTAFAANHDVHKTWYMALNFRLSIYKNASASGGLRPQSYHKLPPNSTFWIRPCSPVKFGLLQLRSCRPSCVDTDATSARAERCRPARARSWPLVAYHGSPTRFTLAVGQVPHHIQDRITDTSSSSPAVSIYTMYQILSIRLVKFNSVGAQRRLRSTITRAAVVRRTRTQFWWRAFAFVVQTFGIARPTLPPAIRTIDSYPAFRRSLKHTLLLTSSYSCFFHWL